MAELSRNRENPAELRDYAEFRRRVDFRVRFSDRLRDGDLFAGHSSSLCGYAVRVMLGR